MSSRSLSAVADQDTSYGLNLGWGGPIGDYIGFIWGDVLRDILQT